MADFPCQRRHFIDRTLVPVINFICSALIVLIVVFEVYTVIMRYLFDNPPFWGDTLSMFCNIWLVLLGYAISVRQRDYIAMQGIYTVLPAYVSTALNAFWDLATGCFGVYLTWYGFIAAKTVPGEFWELGGLPMMVPLMIMPTAGLCMAIMAFLNVAHDCQRLARGQPDDRHLREAFPVDSPGV